ncbi:hypothetical protein KIH75_09300 [Bifidobacterium sp. 64T4]|uniref:hypothetical protein n=1 Tax=Bifidobacterium pongonis TaxID=2834432 RepID=UPI001C598FCE|nr:hypothetical protein [Bifidobacterium pongonis]MBW3095519.1 hypothetical protein [Bifidobacterium pongonis]
MKDSRIWKALNRKYRARLRAAVGEQGAAMLMAVMFVMVVLATSALVLSILLSQALPYKNNKANAQAGYAAESGLEAALSFLREAEASGSASSLLPTTAADAGQSSKDEQFTKAADSTVLLNNVSVNAGTATSKSIAYASQNMSYKVQIAYYDGDPDASGSHQITSASGLSGVQYAVVKSYGYINRYPDGRTGSESKPLRAMRAVYKFEQQKSTPIPPTPGIGGGRTGMGFYSAAPYNGRMDNQPTWKNIDIPDFDTDGNPTGAVKYTNGSGTTGSSDTPISASSVMNPVNQTCMLATSKVIDKAGTLDQMVEANGTPKVGSSLIVLPQAHKTSSSDSTVIYTEQCKSTGAYAKLNTWVYWSDNTIRPSSDMSLCVTGADISSGNIGGGIAKPATLQKCGTPYGVNVSGQSDYYTNTGDDGPQAREKRDPNSTLNQYQKWAFYNGFINAGYFNEQSSVQDEAAEYDASLPESQGFSVGGVQKQKKTRFQVLEVSTAVNSGQDIRYLSGGHWASNIDDFANLKVRFLGVSKWNYAADVTAWFDVAGDMENATASFGQAGEAGSATQQLVNQTSGFCLSTSADGNDVYTDTCHVKSGDFNPYCYKKALTGNPAQQDSDLYTTDYCTVADHNEVAPDDHAEFEEDTSADGSGRQTKIWKTVNGVKKYFMVEGDNVKLTDNESAATVFIRYNANASDKFYKGTFQVGDKCLTEVYPGDKINGTPAYARTDGKPAVVMADRGASTDYLNRSIKSQQWNVSVNWDGSGSGGGAGGGGAGGSTTPEPSSYKGYVTSKELSATYTGW